MCLDVSMKNRVLNRLDHIIANFEGRHSVRQRIRHLQSELHRCPRDDQGVEFFLINWFDNLADLAVPTFLHSLFDHGSDESAREMRAV